MSEKKTIPERSIEAQFLIQEFQKIEPGEIFTYLRMEEVTGVKDRAKLTSLMQTVKRALLSEFEISITNIRNVGYKRDTSSTAAAAYIHDNMRHQKGLKRTNKRVTAINDSELDEEMRQNYHLALTTNQAMLLFNKPTSRKALGEAVKINNNQIPPRKALDIFRNANGKK